MKMNSPPDSSRVVSPVRLSRTSIASSAASPCAATTSVWSITLDVGTGGDLVDQIAGHALLEPVAAVEDRHAARMRREEHGRLPGRVAGADDVDVEAVAVRRLAARRAVGDALAGEAVEALDAEAPPRDAAGEDDRLRAQDVAAVEVHLVRGRVDARDLAGHQDLGAEPPRLLQRSARQLVAGDAGREAEVVLDPRGGAGLAAGRLALDHDRPQPLRRAVDGRRQAGRAGADDHRVVLGGRRLRAQPEQLGDAAQLRPHDGLAADDPDHRAVAVVRQRSAPLLRRVRRLGRDPANVIWLRSRKRRSSVQEASAAMADDDRPRRRRLGRDALQAPRSAHPVGGQPADLAGDVRRDGGDGVVVARLDPHDARLLRRAEARPGTPSRA